MTEDDLDAVVIGSGLGGLAAAGILAAEGKKKVVVLERGKLPGGRCSSYHKQGFTVDVGTHLFNRSEFGPIGELLRRVGREIEWYHVNEFDFETTGPKGEPIRFGFDFGNLVGSLLQMATAVGCDASHFQRGIVPFYEALSKAWELADPETLKNDAIGFGKWIEEILPAPEAAVIRNFLTGLSYSALVVDHERASVGELMRCLKGILVSTAEVQKDRARRGHQSLGYPMGGCIAIPRAIIAGAGLRVEYNAKVTKIVVEDDGDGPAARGVKLEDGREFAADVVINNGGIKEAVELVGPRTYPEEHVRYVEELEVSLAPVVLKVALDELVTDRPFQLLWRTVNSPEEQRESIRAMLRGEPRGNLPLFVPVPSNMDPSLAPEGKQLVIPGSVMPTDLPDAKYEACKREFVEAIWRSLEDWKPGIRDKVLFCDVLDPRVAEREWGERGGPIIGIAQTVDCVNQSRPAAVDPHVKGLYHVGCEAGRGVWGVGTELAVSVGMAVAEYLLGKRKDAP
ncbi:MAG: hypothetical protein Kow0069_35070 [Promethearchaeota archaeon]